MVNKRGRKKGSTKEISNLVFWKGVLQDDIIQEFIDRGTIEQKTTIKNVLKHLKSMEPEFFEYVKGKQILKQLK